MKLFKKTSYIEWDEYNERIQAINVYGFMNNTAHKSLKNMED